MEVSKGFSLGILLISLMILLINTSQLGATSASSGALVKDFQGLYATIAGNMQMELLHSSTMGRMLIEDNIEEEFVTFGALIADEAVLKPPICNRGKPYRGCLPPPNQPPITDTCSTYKRGCPKP
ncbi:hypothetical protein COLO4_37999 [Corchorus olitorius]|uniref:Rapid ALkalinization Factor n=1 Tax=Corchorus olitorius TaxID=93759 RepID=A0A1R3FXJ6_9ROSI|nr:hypothetical protein COLO4_37999 [Corchorus olitorius]